MVTRRSVLKGAVGASALALPVIHNRFTAFAQEATPVAVGTPPLPEGSVLLASGLINPRYLAIAEDGSLYVSEAGVGGDEELFMLAAGTPEASPTPQAPFANRGLTGQVSRIAPDGTVTVVASGFPSYFLLQEGGAVGPAGLVLSGGLILLAIGGEPRGNEPLINENSVVSIDEATGAVTLVADIGAYEVANNPDGYDLFSNLYGMDLGADGLLHVADAGGNAVYHVDPATGSFDVLAVLAGIEIPAEEAPPGGNPNRGGANEMDPVPTGVAANPAGGVFVALLGGFPFPAGSALIQAISDDGTITDVAGGLTMATDVAVGPDGHMYAVQFSMNLLAEVPEPGNVVRVLANGTLEPVVEGLMLPNGIAFDAAGNLYIAAGSNSPPGTDPNGMVLRVDGVAPPA